MNKGIHRKAGMTEVPNVLKEDSNKHLRNRAILKTLIYKENDNLISKLKGGRIFR
jgi:hypothetical protein